MAWYSQALFGTAGTAGTVLTHTIDRMASNATARSLLPFPFLDYNICTLNLWVAKRSLFASVSISRKPSSDTPVYRTPTEEKEENQTDKKKMASVLCFLYAVAAVMVRWYWGLIFYFGTHQKKKEKKKKKKEKGRRRKKRSEPDHRTHTLRIINLFIL